MLSCCINILLTSTVMENKIQELTDKIYHEGVEKGNEEALRIVSEAQAKAEKLIEDARKQAEEIVASAKNQLMS